MKALTKHRIKGVNNGQLLLMDADGNEVRVEADTIIQAGPRRPRQDLESQLRSLADELYMVGDATKPRSLTEAIHEGYKLGVRI